MIRSIQSDKMKMPNKTQLDMFTTILIHVLFFTFGFNISAVFSQNWKQLESMATFTASLSVVFAASQYFRLQLENRIEKTIRIVQSYFDQNLHFSMNVVLKLNTKELKKTVKVVLDSNKIRKTEEIIPDLYSLLAYFEMLGLYVRKNILEFELIEQHFSIIVPNFYEKIRPELELYWKDKKQTEAWKNFEYLAKRIMNNGNAN